MNKNSQIEMKQSFLNFHLSLTSFLIQSKKLSGNISHKNTSQTSIIHTPKN